jgi:hypothetical protein
LTRSFWVNILARAFRRPSSWPLVSRVRDIHRLDPDSEAKLAWVSAQPPLKSSSGADILEINVWTEGEAKCAEHCWHPLETKPSHRAALVSGAEHSDYCCCRCTHGLCHTGTRAAWLDQHPLAHNHRREPSAFRRAR